MRTSIKFLVFCFCFCVSFSSFAWNALGHKIIAQIAFERLNPNAKKEVENLMNSFNREYPKMNSMLDIASWPDEIRGQKIEMFTHWHYIDNAFTTDNSPLKNLIDTDNGVWALNKLMTIVENKKANAYERARFFAFLVHIAGDLHQPLHTVSLISANHTEGDRGGNDFFVVYQKDRMNLHHLWDGGVGILDKDTRDAHVSSLASSITAAYPEQTFAKKIIDPKPENWVEETSEVAKLVTYHATENQAVDTAYIKTGQEAAKKQLALAGYRLAAVLNNLLG